MLGDEVQSRAVKITYNGVEITSKVIINLIKTTGLTKTNLRKTEPKEAQPKGKRPGQHTRN